MLNLLPHLHTLAFLTISPNTILQSGSLLIIALVIFAETGLLFGFILPGDSLLLFAGIFASQGKLDIATLVPVVIMASVIGYETGYEIGRRFGPSIFRRKDGLLFKHEYIEKTQDFFGRHGGKTILLARFVPYVRTFVSLTAGVAKMDRKLFTLYNIAGGILWAGGVTLAGYWLGNAVPGNIDKYIFITLFVGLVVFHGGTFWHIWRDEHRRTSFKKALGEEFNYLFRRNKS